MGTAYQYRCSKCRYDAFCSSVGDRGFTTVVSPMVCKNCQTLADIVIAKYVGDENDPVAELQPHCSNCKSAEGLSNWNEKTCPSCGMGEMQRTGGLLFWD